MKGLIAAAVMFVSLLISVAIGGVISYISYANKGVTYETRIEAVYEENKVVLNSYTVKVQEIAQVPNKFKEDLKEVINATFDGRYGKDGSKAVVSFITENNMTLSPEMYTQIQRVMESGRNDFTVAQQKLIDTTAVYKAALKYKWSGFWLETAGYPTIDLSKYKILTTSDVDTKFETGKDSVIKI